MNGKDYLLAFEGHDFGAPVEGELALADSYSAQLTTKLHLLYGIGEIAFLGDEIKPQAVVESEMTLADSRLVGHIGQLALQTHRLKQAHNGQARNRDKLIFPVYEKDESPDMAIVAKAVESDCETLQANLTQHGDLVMSHALINMQRMSSNNGGDVDGQARESVRLAISSQRKGLLEVLEPWRGKVSFTRDMMKGRQIDFSVQVERNNRHIPDWMKVIDKWHTPLHRLAAALTETESLLVAQEWVIRRGLPYVPIIAPKHLEGGQVYRADRKNPHADLLLCNITPGKNEIIPIQIKNTIRSYSVNRYIEGMKFLTPQSLGLVSSKNHPIRMPDNKVRTGHRVIVEHGNIIEKYYGCYKSGRKPSKADCAELEALLAPGFASLEYLVSA